jgi:hypothetical protein
VGPKGWAALMAALNADWVAWALGTPGGGCMGALLLLGRGGPGYDSEF